MEKTSKSNKRAIVFDTNIFGKVDNYNFINSELSFAIRSLASFSNIDIFFPSIVVNEIKHHIKLNINKDFDSLKTNYVKNFLPENCREKYKDINIKILDDFIKNNKIKIIDCGSYANLEEILSWYFNMKFPFEEHKKDEFPDAIVVSAIKKYFEDKDYNVIDVVSKDNGFISAVKENTKFETYENASKMLNDILCYDIDDLKKIKRFINSKHILCDIDNYEIVNLNENDNVEIENINLININNIDVIGIENNRFDLSIEYSIKIFGNMTILDPRFSNYDNINEKYTRELYRFADEIKSLNQQIFISIYFNQNKEIEREELIEKSVINLQEYLDKMLPLA